MKCEDYQVLIEDYLDGAIDNQAAARVNVHLSTCVQCASFHRELSREQEVYARYQRDIEVTPVLWASIADRIKQERASQPQGLISRLREQLAGAFAAPRLSPAFAAALVIIAIGATVFVMSRLNTPAPREVASGNSNASDAARTGTNSNTVAPPQAPGSQQSGKVELATGKDNSGPAPAKSPAQTNKPARREVAALTPAQLVRDAEYKYLTAIAMLSRNVNSRRSQLDPAMLARFDASLAEIDRTIKETRQVVRGNPEDPIALQYLLAAYSKKVDVLRDMTDDN
jgi:anti-sigma factor RsiW